MVLDVIHQEAVALEFLLINLLTVIVDLHKVLQIPQLETVVLEFGNLVEDLLVLVDMFQVHQTPQLETVAQA